MNRNLFEIVMLSFVGNLCTRWNHISNKFILFKFRRQISLILKRTLKRFTPFTLFSSYESIIMWSKFRYWIFARFTHSEVPYIRFLVVNLCVCRHKKRTWEYHTGFFDMLLNGFKKKDDLVKRKKQFLG